MNGHSLFPADNRILVSLSTKVILGEDGLTFKLAKTPGVKVREFTLTDCIVQLFAKESMVTSVPYLRYNLAV